MVAAGRSEGENRMAGLGAAGFTANFNNILWVFRERYTPDSAYSTISRLENRAEKAIFRGFFMDLGPNALESYFARVNYVGPWEPSRDVLRELQYRHTHAVPFENL